MSITIKDVANLSGVSVTTVSRFLNQRGYISQTTAQKIHKAIHDLNYSPNQLARSLYNNQTHTIGLIVPSVVHPFFAQLTQLLEQKLYSLNYHVLLCTTDNNKDRESDILNIMKQHRMDGIIMASPSLPEHEYEKLGIPIVAFDTLMESANVSVAANHHLGGHMVADVLIKGGCRYAVQIVGNPEAKTDATRRHRVFMNEMMQNGCTCVSIPVMTNCCAISDYERVVQQILKDHPNADAFFATDLYALVLEKELIKSGKHFPKDVQIVSYDGTYITDTVFPRLTVIRQPFEELSQYAVSSMMHLLQGEHVESKIILDKLELVYGDTTACTEMHS